MARRDTRWWTRALAVHAVAVAVTLAGIGLLTFQPKLGEFVGPLFALPLLVLSLPWTPLGLSGVPGLYEVAPFAAPVLTLAVHAAVVRRRGRVTLVTSADGAADPVAERRSGGWWPWLLAAHAVFIVCSVFSVWLAQVTGSTEGVDWNILLIEVGAMGMGLPWSLVALLAPQHFLPAYGPIEGVDLLVFRLLSYGPAVLNFLLHAFVFRHVRRRRARTDQR